MCDSRQPLNGADSASALDRIRESLQERRTAAQAALDGIPPTEPDTALWHDRHEVALRLQGAIAALDDSLATIEEAVS